MQVLSKEWILHKPLQASFKPRKPKAHMLQAGTVYACDKSICSHSEDCSSSNESFCLQVKIQQSEAEGKKIPSHLITNLAYKLKPHWTGNQYLRTRLDTCKDVNIMLASVYKLVFNDPELKKLSPSTLEIGTYTTNTVKIVGSCLFYLVHPDTKKLKSDFLCSKMMVVSYYLALQHLHLDMYNLAQDWSIYLPELV